MNSSIDISKIKETIAPLGDKATEIFQQIVTRISSMGMGISVTATKIIAIIILVGGVYLTIKILSKINKLVGFVIIVLLLALIASIGFSF